MYKEQLYLGKRVFLFSAGGNIVSGSLEGNLAMSDKVTIGVPFELTVPVLRVYLTGIKAPIVKGYTHTEGCMFYNIVYCCK